jgi:hypothetical protein
MAILRAISRLPGGDNIIPTAGDSLNGNGTDKGPIPD